MAAADEPDIMKIIPLGGFQEVGRSCAVLSIKQKNIMLDCGAHPKAQGQDCLPFFDCSPDMDLATIDLCLITHFHVDHIASLPYLTEHTNFKGEIYMTPATKAIGRLIMSDFVRIYEQDDTKMLYTTEDLDKCLSKVKVLNYRQSVELQGIRFMCYPAGHVLGAAMFAIEVAGQTVFYTGDFSMGDERHLPQAPTPVLDYKGARLQVKCLIVESTMGVGNHTAQTNREKDLLDFIVRKLSKGGRILMPMRALGRAQELQLVLEETWDTNNYYIDNGRVNLHQFPLYYSSRMADKSLKEYRKFSSIMNARFKQRQRKVAHHPFDFKYLQAIDHRTFEDDKPCVMIASPGTLDSGFSRTILEMWCASPLNAVVICGLAMEGTMSKTILQHPKEIDTLEGQYVDFRCEVQNISFNGHADYQSTSHFIRELDPEHVILAHGSSARVEQLAARLKVTEPFNRRRDNVHAPVNGVEGEVEITFKEERVATVIGNLATEPRKDGDAVDGVLVSKDFSQQLMLPADIPQLTQLGVTRLQQEITIPFQETLPTLLRFVRRVYDPELPDPGGDPASVPAMVVCERVKVFFLKSKLRLEWQASPNADMVADSLITLALQAQIAPSSLRISSPACGKASPSPTDRANTDRAGVHVRLLQSRFEQVQQQSGKGKIFLVKDGSDAVQFNPRTRTVTGPEHLATRVRDVIKTLDHTLMPIAIPKKRDRPNASVLL